MREFDQAVGDARHGRDDRHDAMPGALGFDDAARDVADALGVADAVPPYFWTSRLMGRKSGRHLAAARGRRKGQFAAAALPEPRDAVGVESRVAADQRALLAERLRHDEPVEGVAVMSAAG